ncbi:MAG: hypothetical protein CVV28_06225 [Methanobacteriales archaeon HGW-Methanobacteriales-1]|nr:MAG: hypothetical protein CVV28_06225 [Methanobacteriales archaeon HGW-Methanobacteriales-1]
MYQNTSCQAIEENLGLKCSMCQNKCPAALITKKGREEILRFILYLMNQVHFPKAPPKIEMNWPF